jgi:hypothetical protein
MNISAAILRVLADILQKHPPSDRSRPCAYCKAGYHRHGSNAPGHYHTIVVKCWDQDPPKEETSHG